MTPLLDVKNLTVRFGKGRRKITAVDGVTFSIFKGETFGVVGESGSGKTTVGRSIIRVNPIDGGEVVYKGERISGKVSRQTDKRVTREIQMIFQDPMSSLNERAKVSYIVSEGIIDAPGITKEQRNQKVAGALNSVGLLPAFSSRFPHEFSGGQRQRIGIARALSREPEFIIADEPISALDVSIRAQVLNLMNELKNKYGLTYLFISHDLSVMRFICDRIAVMNLGKIVELSETEKLFKNPLHPYTKALLSAIPLPDPAMKKVRRLVTYDPAVHDYSFFKPEWREIEPEHFVLGNKPELESYKTALQS
jgi:oligopeptide transport system ATP-binding protein